jgi:tyrosyl-DNA phosphodiesterase-1
VPCLPAERLGLPRPGAQGLQLVWTSVEEVQNSIEGWKAGGSIPGPPQNVDKPFLQPYYRRWAGGA